jgi:hypothetical protein
MKRHDNCLCDRSGVALIMVIGLLALMMVMGVAFTVYMRTERTVAGNFMQDVKARQLLYVALNRALEDIDTSVGTLSYPPWIVKGSAGASDAGRVTNGTALGLIPGAVLQDALTAAGTNGFGVHWISVDEVRGRVAYLAFNCSGLLDANFSGGWTNRGIGTNVCEIQIDVASDVLPGTGVGILTNKRSYLTQQELIAVATNSGALSTVQNFVVYSAFPRGSEVNIGGNVSELVSNKNAIIQAFQISGVVNPGVAFTNLVDYVDNDIVPGNLGVMPWTNAFAGDLAVEPVWMFDEMVLSNSVTFTSGMVGTNPVYNVQNNGTVSYECAAPFVNPPTNSFSWTFPTSVSNRSAGLGGLATNFLARWNNLQLNGTTSYYARVYTFANTTVIPASLLPTSMVVRVEVSGTVVSNGINAVDVVGSRANFLTIPVSALNSNQYYGQGVISYECADPRLNHMGSQWGSSSPSLGMLNGRTLAMLSADGTDGSLAMYIRNSTLRNAGELGCLFFGAAGQTIRLYRHGTNASQGEVHRVLDYFTVGAETNGVERGKVHLGSRQRDVLSAVYQDMPVDVPGPGSQPLLSGMQLEQVVDGVLGITSGMSNAPLRLSDLGATNWGAIASAVGFPGANDLARESIVRNASGLFGVRQNYFLILLYAQTVQGVVMVSDTKLESGVRALAEVWRDPQTNSVGRHRIVVRSFKILNE